MPILMSVIVDGGLYREEDFILRSLFPDALVANRNRFVLVVGAVMVFGCTRNSGRGKNARFG